ncbi:MAG: Ig-like domain-containing protein [Patescibacteria group bacterium]
MAKRTSYYKPQSQNTWQAVKRLLLAVFGITAVSTLLFFVTIPLFSRIDTLWEILAPNTETQQVTDQIPPAPPYLKPLPTAVKEQTLALEGFSEPGAKITLFHNEKKLEETLVDNEGAFSFNNIQLKKGENSFQVQAKDKAGNKSGISKTQTVIFDNEPPKLTIEQPEDGKTIEKEEERKIEIKGITEPDIRVTVNKLWAKVEEEKEGDTKMGKFNYQLRLEEGENVLKIVAEDEAGNKTTKEITVSYEPEEENED